MGRPRTFDRAKVAVVLLEALEIGLPTIATVMSIFDVTDTRARYMIRCTKEDGLLGVPGHRAVVALLSRGASDNGHRRLLVCQHCQTTWPCPSALPKTSKRTRK